MEPAKTDRRVRKTKARLLECLTALMKEKDIKDISVKELSDLADINRGTFYLHYRDVYDMLNKVEDELFAEFNEILSRDFTIVPEDTIYTILEDIFTFLYDNVQTAQALMGRGSHLYKPDERRGKAAHPSDLAGKPAAFRSI